MLILPFQTSFIYCIMFTKERQFKQVLTSKSFIIEKSLSGFVRKVELYEIVAKNRSLFRHYYTVILTQGLSNFYLSITPFTEAGFKQPVFMDNVIPSGFTVLLTSPEAATRVVLYEAFSCEYCEMFKDTYFEEQLRMAAPASHPRVLT